MLPVNLRASSWCYSLAIGTIIALSLGCGSDGNGGGEVNSANEHQNSNGEVNENEETPTNGAPDNFDGCPKLAAADVVDGKVLPAHTCYRVEESLTVESGALVIEEGVYVGYMGSAGLNIEAEAELDAVGNAGDEIVFMMANDDAMRPWTGITLNETNADNRLEHVIIEDAEHAQRAAVLVDGSTLTMVDSTIRASANGIRIRAHSDATVDRNLIEGTMRPIEVTYDSAGGIGDENVLQDNDSDAIYFSLQFPQGEFDATIPNTGYPYFWNNCPDWLDLYHTNTLTIEPGTELYFDPICGINISGHLVAEGTQDSPILFSYIQDAPTGSYEGNPSGWAGITFNPGTGVLRHVIIETVDVDHNQNRDALRLNASVLPGDQAKTAAEVLVEDVEIRDAAVGVGIKDEDNVLESCDNLEFHNVETHFDDITDGKASVCEQ